MFSETQDMEKLPPTEDALLQHTKRSLFQTGVWMVTTAEPDYPLPKDNGWKKKDDGKYTPLWITIPEVAKNVQVNSPSANALETALLAAVENQMHKETSYLFRCCDLFLVLLLLNIFLAPRLFCYPIIFYTFCRKVTKWAHLTPIYTLMTPCMG